MYRISTLTLALMAALAAPAFATSLSTGASALSELPEPAINTVNLQSNPSGTVISTVSFPPPPDLGHQISGQGDPYATAVASDGGAAFNNNHSESLVVIDALMTNDRPQWQFEATATTNFSAINSFDNAEATLALYLDPIALLIEDQHAGIQDGIEVGFEYWVKVDGVIMSEGAATLSGDNDAGRSLNLSTPWGNTVPAATTIPGGVQIAGMYDTFSLGLLAAGGSVNVETWMRAWLHTPSNTTGGAFYFTNGGGLTADVTMTPLSGGATQRSPGTAPVPEPASALILAIGVAGMAMRRRFRA